MKMRHLWSLAAVACLIAAPLSAQAETLQVKGPALDANGNPITSAVYVTACTPYHLPNGSGASNNAASVASGPHTVCAWRFLSTGSVISYVKVYDVAGAPTCSSATGLKHVYPVLTSSTGGGEIIVEPLQGEAYQFGIGICVVGGGSDTDNTNAPTGVYVEGNFN